MIIDIVIFLIIFGLLGGLIYLIYLPFKRKLLKSGRLTKKLNRQINWIYIISIFLICILLFCFRDAYRTPSNTRLENVSNIKLPDNYKVIKDEYRDMLQDYCINYEIQFDSLSTKEFIQSIKESRFYNPKANHDDIWLDSDKAAWVKSAKGYKFNKPNGRTTYYISLDTLTNRLSYNEYAD